MNDFCSLLLVHLCVLIMNKLISDRNVFFWKQVVRGDGTGPSSGTQSEKVWEPLPMKDICHALYPIYETPSLHFGHNY